MQKKRLRIVHDALSANVHTKSPATFAFRTIRSVLTEARYANYAFCVDFRSFYYQFRLEESVRDMSVAKVMMDDGTIRFIRPTRMPMGFAHGTSQRHFLQHLQESAHAHCSDAFEGTAKWLYSLFILALLFQFLNYSSYFALFCAIFALLWSFLELLTTCPSANSSPLIYRRDTRYDRSTSRRSKAAGNVTTAPASGRCIVIGRH